MKREEIENQIKQKVIEILELDQNRNVEPQEDLIMLGLDSFKSVSLVVELEMMFDIEFADDELLLQNYSSIERIVDNVSNRLFV
ncbi:acyl carrier protein [Paenibacillus pinisoli]|uniref:Acyl carrier protein n=1 Tax=Paenibacillus pinisoli TaxID=1276110 RepID=A0A3A6PC88_9BACL|nr:acyl carrier protein [Paenibacillus pinisoli]RJX37520.1 acyl carrier protein [Paenibacillus pinisoli]